MTALPLYQKLPFTDTYQNSAHDHVEDRTTVYPPPTTQPPEMRAAVKRVIITVSVIRSP